MRTYQDLMAVGTDEKARMEFAVSAIEAKRECRIVIQLSYLCLSIERTHEPLVVGRTSRASLLLLVIAKNSLFLGFGEHAVE